MKHPYWQRQTIGKALFPDLVWSQPENKQQAGKLLIIGGNLHSFAAPAEAFAEAERAGVGSARVLLPDSAKKMVGTTMPQLDYAPSTPSGSFSQKALADILEHAAWADAVLIAGDLGRNSETSILIEKFMQKYSGQLVLAKDAVDYATQISQTTLDRTNTLLVLSLAQLQKLAVKAKYSQAFTFGMDLLRFIDALHGFSTKFSPYLIVKHSDQIHCAINGQIVSTPAKPDSDIWRVKTAAHAAVWWLQNPIKPLEALATAALSVSG